MASNDEHGEDAPVVDNDVDVYDLAVDGGNIRVIRLTNFSLADHIENLAARSRKSNPFIPPVGTPINNLPNELLSYIFTLGTDADGDDDDDELEDEAGMGMLDMFEEDEESDDEDNDDKPQVEFQVLVSHVCRRWRDVALETPTLWTALDFSEGPPFEKSRIWIERSKECLLEIDIDCTLPDQLDDDDIAEEVFPVDGDEEDEDENDSELENIVNRPPRASASNPQSRKKESQKTVDSDGRVKPEDLPAVRDLILPHVARWRVFEFMVNDYAVMHNILSTLASAGEATQLEGLRLYHYEDTEQYDTFEPAHLNVAFVPFGGRAPSLTHVALWGVHFDWEACTFLEGLYNLELAYHAHNVRPSYDVFTRTLKRSPKLETLTLCLSGPFGIPKEWPTEIIRLPSIVTLVLAFHDLDYISELMKRFAFPNLKSLALDFDAEDFSLFLLQLARPAPGLKKSLLNGLAVLKISGLHCSLDVLDKFYSSLPNLTTLNLNFYHLDQVFFNNLFPAGHANDPKPSRVRKGVWLPRLETLTTSGINGTQMHELISARSGNPIKRVFMDMDDDVRSDDEQWLRENVEQFEFFEGSDDEDISDDGEDDEEDDEEDADAHGLD